MHYNRFTYIFIIFLSLCGFSTLKSFQTAGITPFAYDKGKTWFLLGREFRNDEWVAKPGNYWFDFRRTKKTDKDRALEIAYDKLMNQTGGVYLKDPYVGQPFYQDGEYTRTKIVDRDAQLIFNYRTAQSNNGKHLGFFLPAWEKVKEEVIREKALEKNPGLKNHAWSWVEGETFLRGKTGLEEEFYPPFTELLSSKDTRRLILRTILANPQENTDAWKNRPTDLGLNEDIPFVILILSYKNAAVYQQNLNSVFDQTYNNYRIIYVDDASPDGTGNFVEAYIKKVGKQDKVHLIKNKTNQGALKNNYDVVHNYVKNNEIVVVLDGDDWLSHKNVLALLSIVYSSPAPDDVWLTYGQFEYAKQGTLGIAQQIPFEVLKDNTIRSYPWVTSALRTYRADLFKHINLEDLQYSKEGKKQFFETANDLAVTLAMVEMAQWHTRFIPDVLYIYNAETPSSTFKVKPGKEKVLEQIIRAKKPYSPLKKL